MEELSRTRPIVIVMEDGEHMDAASLKVRRCCFNGCLCFALNGDLCLLSTAACACSKADPMDAASLKVLDDLVKAKVHASSIFLLVGVRAKGLAAGSCMVDWVQSEVRTMLHLLLLLTLLLVLLRLLLLLLLLVLTRLSCRSTTTGTTSTWGRSLATSRPR